MTFSASFYYHVLSPEKAGRLLTWIKVIYLARRSQMNPGIQLFLLQQEISPFQITSKDMTDKIHVRKIKLPQLQ